MRGLWIVKLITYIEELKGTHVTRYTFFDCESALTFAYDHSGYDNTRVAVKYKAGNFVVR